MDYEDLIIENIDNPQQLEGLYRKDPQEFKHAFNKVYSLNQESMLLRVWRERLYYESDVKEEGKTKNKFVNSVLFVIVLALFAGAVSRLLMPMIEKDIINPINIVLAVALFISVYFGMRSMPIRKILISVGILFAMTAAVINVLPNFKDSQSTTLASIHAPFFIWILVGILFLGNQYKDPTKWMDYLRLNGESIIYGVLLGIGFMFLTALTLGLFSAIGLQISDFYTKNILAFAASGIPIAAIHLALTKKKDSFNLASYIAKIFSPLVLLMLAIYLVSIIVFQKNPYIDRNFLILFNAMLILVVSIIIFVLSGRENVERRHFGDYINFSMVCIALIIDAIALLSILFRLSSFGISINRIAVLCINLIIFGHLSGVAFYYIKFLGKKVSIAALENWVVKYIPVYAIWTVIVTFLFPLIFWFK